MDPAGDSGKLREVSGLAEPGTSTRSLFCGELWVEVLGFGLLISDLRSQLAAL